MTDDAHTTERPNLGRRALMEAIGSFALVTAGCGAIITNATHPGSLGGAGISLVFGLVIMVMIYAGGHLSGAHYNPSVTLAFTLARHFPLRDALAYIGAQLVGASAAALLLLAAWPSKPAHPEVVEVMRELGIDLSDRQPRLLTGELAQRADVIVTMGCGDDCPYIPGKRYVDWDLPDPKDRPIQEVRATRDEIRRRVTALVAELDERVS